MTLIKPHLTNALIVLASTAIALIVAEGICRLIDYPPRPRSGWQWAESAYKSEANKSDNRVNQLGLRGRPIAYGESDYVILLVGDSQVEAGWQPFADMPEQILEDAFKRWRPPRNVKVVSIASAGWGQDQELVWLDRYFRDYSADLVVNFFTPTNDYFENTFIDRSFSRAAGPLKPTYRLTADGGLELLLDPSSRWRLVELVRRAWARIKAGENTPVEEIYVRDWIDALPQSNVVPVRGAACPQFQVSTAPEVISALRSGRGKITMRTHENIPEGRTQFSPFIVPLSERERYQIALTHRLLGEMQRLAAVHGADFRIFYWRSNEIDQYRKSIACIRDEADGKYYMLDMQDMLRFIDTSEAAKLVIAVDISSPKPTLVSDYDWHLNRAGNERAMDGLAEALMRAGKIR